MPLLTQRGGMQRPPVPAPHASRVDDDARPAYDPMACLCGARLPMQVRLGLRSRTRPVLESRWACSERCLHARVSSLVRRGLPTRGVPRVHTHRVPLGLLLLQSGRISQEQLQYALKVSQNSEHRIGEVLVRDCGLSEQALAAALARQWGCGSWDVRGIRSGVAACFAPHVVLARTGMLPVRELRDGRLAVAFTDAPDPQAILALQRIHDRSVDAGIATPSQISEALAHVEQADGVPMIEAVCRSRADLVNEIVRRLQKLQPVESRWARVHNILWLRMWLEPGALLGGLAHTEDVVDLTVHLPEGLALEGEA